MGVDIHFSNPWQHLCS